MGLSFGLSVIAYLLFGYFIGVWVDNKLQTTPVFLIVGLLLASVLIYRAFNEMLKVLEQSQRVEEGLRKERIDKEELHKRKVEEARKSLEQAKSILVDFEEMISEKERQALRRIRGEKEEDPAVDKRDKIKKY
ncbi:MAG: AtpZ/AtpI family protein [Firmicutes bacterium]|nr:AtpZ/AtpI family protein [Bacillota bacterium]